MAYPPPPEPGRYPPPPPRQYLPQPTWPGHYQPPPPPPPGPYQSGPYSPPGYLPPGYLPPGSGMVPYRPGMVPYPPGYGFRPRGRALGAIVSFFIPGVGSMINGSVGRGFIILAAYLVGCALCLLLIGFVIVPVIWIWAVIDGALSADRWNRKHGVIS